MCCVLCCVVLCCGVLCWVVLRCGVLRGVVLVTHAWRARRPLPSAALLREAFGLTDAELRVARALSGGGTAVETARQLGIRETTIRTHLRRLYAKTGTSGLGELVALLREPRWLDAPD